MLDFFCQQTLKTSPDFVVAHNAKFDLGVLQAEFDRLSRENPVSRVPTICTMLTTTEFCDLPSNLGTPKWPKLPELYEKIAGRPPGTKHNALSDVHTLISCFMALCQLGLYESLGIRASDFQIRAQLAAETDGAEFGFKWKLVMLVAVHLVAALGLWYFLRRL